MALHLCQQPGHCTTRREAILGRKGLPPSLSHSPSPERGASPVPEGRDEVEAAVYSVVLDVLPVQAALITEILFKLLVDVVGDGLPAGKENSIKTKSRVTGHCLQGL